MSVTTKDTRRLWVVGAIVAIALGLLVFKGLGNATLYFRTADEAVAQRQSLGDKRFRIQGNVVPGTVAQTGNDVAFDIEANGTQVHVLHRGDPPELFKPNIPVVLEGRFQGNDFASDRILVKHTETYVAEHPERVSTPQP